MGIQVNTLAPTWARPSIMVIIKCNLPKSYFLDPFTEDMSSIDFIAQKMKRTKNKLLTI